MKASAIISGISRDNLGIVYSISQASSSRILVGMKQICNRMRDLFVPAGLWSYKGFGYGLKIRQSLPTMRGLFLLASPEYNSGRY